MRRTSGPEIRAACQDCRKSCGCKHVNHLAAINRETVKHYRDLLYDEDKSVNQYFRRVFVYKMVDEIIRKEYRSQLRTWRLCGKDMSKMKIERYYLTDAVTQRQVPVCHEVFCKVLGLSPTTVNRVVRDCKAGKPVKMDQRTILKVKEVHDKPEYLAIASFLEGLAELLANESPDTRSTELPDGHKCHYYDMFRAHWAEGVLHGLYYRSRDRFSDPTKPPSKSLFYKVWRCEFSSLKVPKRHNRFSKCDWCVTIKSNIQMAHNGGDKDEATYWKAFLYGHYKYVVLQRKKYHKHRRKAADEMHEWVTSAVVV
jgi:hypothetical protein